LHKYVDLRTLTGLSAYTKFVDGEWAFQWAMTKRILTPYRIETPENDVPNL